MKRNKEDILDRLREKYDNDEDYSWAAGNILCEDGSWLNDFADEEEFYTDDLDYYVPAEYAEYELYDHAKALKYIEENKLWDDLWEYGLDIDVKTSLIIGNDYYQSQFKNIVQDFIKEDYSEYMDYVMGAGNEERA